jgi:nitrile hydratase accessory protein
LAPPTKPGCPFEEPWHAQLFATTHALAAAGAFRWSDWTVWFGAAIARADAEGAPRDGSTYYEIWLSAFEAFLRDRDLADAATLAELRGAWEAAYLATPHGEPVELAAGRAVGHPPDCVPSAAPE